jgi:hypothetical protein
MTKLWMSALVAAVAAFGLKIALAGVRAIPLAVVDLGLFGVLYGVLTLVLKVPEAHALIRRFRR